MGYSTQFEGQIAINPPLSEAEREFLTKFSETRRMQRKSGPYFVDGTGYGGQGEDADITNYNSPPDGQPSHWCQWVPNKDGTAIEWDQGEKFYRPEEWMRYLIDHFLKPSPKSGLPFLRGHSLNGTILAQGDSIGDRWRLHVVDNEVSREDLA